jgi:acyl-CoA thioesterase-1
MVKFKILLQKAYRIYGTVAQEMKFSLKRFAVTLFAVILVASLTIVFFNTQSAAADVVRVACVGDSITSDTNYPEVLSTMLGDNYTVGDFGVGRTTVSLQFNKPYMNQPACQSAQKFNPDIVVIMLGTNDAYLSQQERSNFVEDYKTLIAAFQSLASSPEIYIATPPPVFANLMGLNATILDNEVRPLVDQTATDLGLSTIDTCTSLLDNPEYFPDGVHPNTDGAQALALKIYNTII